MSRPTIDGVGLKTLTLSTPSIEADFVTPVGTMCNLTSTELEVWEQQFAKSVKADDATTPIHLWDMQIWRVGIQSDKVTAFQSRFNCCPLVSLRHFLLRRWWRNVRQSLLKYLMEEHGRLWYATTQTGQLKADCEAEAECLWRATEADWWEWKSGSRLFFWRWPKEHRREARDGYSPYVQGPLPAYKRPQPAEKDLDTRRKVAEKLSTVRSRGYISKGFFQSLTSYFSVPK